MARMVKTEPTSSAQLPIPRLQPIMATSVTSSEASSAQTVMTRISTKLFRMPRNTALRILAPSPPRPAAACGTEKKAEKANMAMPK